MTRTQNLNLANIERNDKIWDSITALNENMNIIDETFGDFLTELEQIVGGVS